ncbi:hypothetical protein [Streptomyces lydicus]
MVNVLVKAPERPFERREAGYLSVTPLFLSAAEHDHPWAAQATKP